MVNFDFKELKDMDYLGRGLFSKVYKKDDNTAYKIYEKYIKTEWGKIKKCQLEITDRFRWIRTDFHIYKKNGKAWRFSVFQK